MRARTRWVILSTLGLGLALVLTACMGFFDTGLQEAMLLVSGITVTGAQGTVYIAVADMPSGGAASIGFGTVGTPAITISDIDETTIAVQGLNGFTALAWQFTATGGTIIAANGNTGVVSGQILKITFAVTAAGPTFTVDAAKVTIGSDLNTLIAAASWALSDKDYYTK